MKALSYTSPSVCRTHVECVCWLLRVDFPCLEIPFLENKKIFSLHVHPGPLRMLVALLWGLKAKSLANHAKITSHPCVNVSVLACMGWFAAKMLLFLKTGAILSVFQMTSLWLVITYQGFTSVRMTSSYSHTNGPRHNAKSLWKHSTGDLDGNAVGGTRSEDACRLTCSMFLTLSQ